MAIIEHISIGWLNGWWFTAVFGLVNLYFLVKYRNHRRFSKRLFRFPTFDSVFERVISMINVILFMRGMMIFSIFISFDIRNVWFYVGLSMYLVGLAFYINALKSFAETREDRPVVTDVYRLSRHPMQIFSLIMWVGVGIATTNWIVLLICSIQPFLAYYFLRCQERFCLEQYGEEYQTYLQKTPRYLVFI